MLTIGKVAARTKVTPDTLRYYERERLLSPSGKTGAGYRLYGAEAVRSIRFATPRNAASPWPKSASCFGFGVPRVRIATTFAGVPKRRG